MILEIDPLVIERIVNIHQRMHKSNVEKATFLGTDDTTYEYVFVNRNEFQYGLKGATLTSYVWIGNKWVPYNEDKVMRDQPTPIVSIVPHKDAL